MIHRCYCLAMHNTFVFDLIWEKYVGDFKSHLHLTFSPIKVQGNVILHYIYLIIYINIYFLFLFDVVIYILL